MDVKFSQTDPEPVEPIYFEKIWGEKPGGGMVSNPSFNLPKTLAVGRNSDGLLAPIKAYRLVKAVAINDTTIEIAKGSGVVVGDIIAHGGVAVACSEVDTTTSADKDVVTVTLGIVIPNGTVLYQSSAASNGSGTKGVFTLTIGTKPAAGDKLSLDGVDYVYAAAEGDAVFAVGADAKEAAKNIEDAVSAQYDGIFSVVAKNGKLIFTQLKGGIGAIPELVVTPVAETGTLAATIAQTTAGAVAVAAAPIYSPEYILGDVVYAGQGDQLVKLVNGANVRKETVNASKEVLALLNGINAV